MNFEMKRGYRAQRIERAAAELMECDVLPSFDDPMLEHLNVVSVQAAGGLACLHVLLAPNAPEHVHDPEKVEAALRKVEGRVRTLLAAGLRIKRMPVVRLRYVPLAVGARPDAPGGAHD